MDRRGAGPCSPASLRQGPSAPTSCWTRRRRPRSRHLPRSRRRRRSPRSTIRHRPSAAASVELGVMTQPCRFRNAVPPELCRRLRRIGYPTSQASGRDQAAVRREDDRREDPVERRRGTGRGTSRAVPGVRRATTEKVPMTRRNMSEKTEDPGDRARAAAPVAPRSRQRRSETTATMASTPASMPAPKLPGAKMRPHDVVQDLSRAGVGEAALEAVADLDAHAALLPRHDEEHAVVDVLPAELPRLEDPHRVVLDRVALEAVDREDGDLGACPLLEVRRASSSRRSRTSGGTMFARSLTRAPRNGTLLRAPGAGRRRESSDAAWRGGEPPGRSPAPGQSLARCVRRRGAITRDACGADREARPGRPAAAGPVSPGSRSAGCPSARAGPGRPCAHAGRDAGDDLLPFAGGDDGVEAAIGADDDAALERGRGRSGSRCGRGCGTPLPRGRPRAARWSHSRRPGRSGGTRRRRSAGERERRQPAERGAAGRGSAIQSATGPPQNVPGPADGGRGQGAREAPSVAAVHRAPRVAVRALDGVGHDLAGALGLDVADGGLDRRVIRLGEEPLEWQGRRAS